MTRMTKLFALACGLGGLLVLSACDITEMNEDPNQSTEPTTGYILTDAEINFADAYWSGFNNGRFGLLYAQYWTQNTYTSEDRYQYRPGVVDGYWSSLYLNLNNLKEIKRLVRANPSSFESAENQIAVANIMQVYLFQVATDIWGDVPYTEALEGAANRSPAYTPQAEIYPALLDSLTAAQAQIDVSGTVPGDIVFNGNAAKWKMFANSLKMRVAMRMADRLPDVAATAINEAIAAGPMMSVGDAATISFLSAQPYSNPYYENLVLDGRDDWAVTQNLVTILQEKDDPRLPIYAAPTPASAPTSSPAYVGLRYGLSETDAPGASASTYSRPGAAVQQASSPALLMLYDEVLFIKAEAAARGFIGGDANSFFRDAVRASMNYWGASGNVDSYVSSLPAVTAANFRQEIGVQKWLALYMQGIQGWSEFRRLDFTGVFVDPAGGKADQFEGRFPVRMVYPQQEGSLNEASLEAAVARQGADTQGTLLWWDVSKIGA